MSLYRTVEKRNSYVMAYLIAVPILLMCLLGWKLTLENVAVVFGNSFMLLAIMCYNYKMIAAYMTGVASGIISYGLGGNIDGLTFGMFSAVGLLIGTIRVLHLERSGKYKFESKGIKRLAEWGGFDALKIVEIDHLYRAMAIVVLATLVVTLKDTEGVRLAAYDINLAIIVASPFIIGAFWCFGSIDFYISELFITGIELGVLDMAAQSVYGNSPEMWFELGVRILITFTVVYSFWFGNKQSEKELI